MEKSRLNKVEINNAEYSTDKKVNNTSLWLAEQKKNYMAGNLGYAAQCYFKAVSSVKYE